MNKLICKIRKIKIYIIYIWEASTEMQSISIINYRIIKQKVKTNEVKFIW